GCVFPDPDPPACESPLGPGLPEDRGPGTRNPAPDPRPCRSRLRRNAHPESGGPARRVHPQHRRRGPALPRRDAPGGAGPSGTFRRILRSRHRACTLPRMRRNRKIGALLVGTCAALVLAGCGYPPRQHVVSTPGSTALFGLDAGSGGTSWDLVLPSPLASAAPAGAEAARRDADLSVVTVIPR